MRPEDLDRTQHGQVGHLFLLPIATGELIAQIRVDLLRPPSGMSSLIICLNMRMPGICTGSWLRMLGRVPNRDFMERSKTVAYSNTQMVLDHMAALPSSPTKMPKWLLISTVMIVASQRGSHTEVRHLPVQQTDVAPHGHRDHALLRGRRKDHIGTVARVSTLEPGNPQSCPAATLRPTHSCRRHPIEERSRIWPQKTTV